MTILVIFIGTAGLYLLYTFDPSTAAVFLPCPFKTITGLRCPGCGAQRAVHDLLHGHVGHAFRHNPLVVIGLPYVTWGLLQEYILPDFLVTRLRRRFFGLTAITIWFFGILVFWTVRLLCSSCW